MTPRGSCTDWLDEHGDHCAQVHPRPNRAGRIAKTNGGTIHSPHHCLVLGLRKWHMCRAHKTESIRKGFNTFWSGSAQEFLVAAPAYWRLGPVEEIIVWVERRNEATTKVVYEVATSEWLQRVRDLRVSGRLVSDEWVLELSRSAAAGKWRRLVIEGSRLSDAACNSLVTSVLVSTGCTLVVLLSGRISGWSVDQLISAFGDRLCLGHGPRQPL